MYLERGLLIKRTVERWFKKFRCGNKSLHDEENLRRYLVFDKLNSNKLKAQVKVNPHTSLR